MKKKIFSLILAVVLVVSMMTVAMVSASAKIDSNGRYEPADPDATYRYYFYMPKGWENTFTKEKIAGVYWFGGTDACSAVDGSNPEAPAWPGYIAQYEGSYDEGSVYYVDCPDDVATIIWNNYVNGGNCKDGVYEISKEQFEAAKQTIDISGLDDAELYANEELYPEGLEDFGDMIYVLDFTKVSVNALSGKETYGGEWYYYYGEGKYGLQPTLEEAEAADAVMNTAYQPPVDPDATPDVTPVTPGTEDPATQPTTAPDNGNGNGNGNNTDSTKPTAGSPSGNNAKSSTNDTAKNTTDNGTVQTGDASMAFIILFSVAAAAGVAIFARKKIFG